MADLDAASGPGAGRAGHRGRATGIVLAGGRSSRFGRDKLAERLDDRPLLAHVVERVARACREVLVVVPPGGRTAGAPVAEVPDAAGPRAAGAADFG
ncbi:MAG TPA: NTP transferase domain-containing protein, partial [Candidatus Limnocylindrales bacterium]|nr:NTP transferase domain-containing protein [Candidatus Limnocylindrales bacterium]